MPVYWSIDVLREASRPFSESAQRGGFRGAGVCGGGVEPGVRGHSAALGAVRGRHREGSTVQGAWMYGVDCGGLGVDGVDAGEIARGDRGVAGVNGGGVVRWVGGGIEACGGAVCGWSEEAAGGIENCWRMSRK